MSVVKAVLQDGPSSEGRSAGPAVSRADPRKAAVLMTCMAPLSSAAVFGALDPDEVEFLRENIQALPPLPAEIRHNVAMEFLDMAGEPEGDLDALVGQDLSRVVMTLRFWLGTA